MAVPCGIFPTSMTETPNTAERARLQQAINLRLTVLGFAPLGDPASMAWARLSAPLLARQQEQARLQPVRLCPVDERIQAYLDRICACGGPAPRLPARSFVLDLPGLARELSLPPLGDTASSPFLKSYRLRNGILHNPASDRRTTCLLYTSRCV